MAKENPFLDTILCVVGNINRDVKCAPLAPSKNLFQDGATGGDWVAETVGGGGANSALAAAALGAKVHFVGQVGNDALAARLERTLQDHGVEPFLPRDKIERTGSTLAMAWQNGHRHFLSNLPASRALRFANIPLKALSHCAHLLRADIWFSEEMLLEGNAALFKEARKKGMTVSVDLNWDPEWGCATARKIRERKKAVRRVLSSVDLAHGNVREMCEFTDAPNLRTALEILSDCGVGAVVAHLGSKGAGWFEKGSFIVEPAKLARRQVNVTGTGDLLSVCMMLLHQTSLSVGERLRVANAVVRDFIEGRRRLIPELSD